MLRRRNITRSNNSGMNERINESTNGVWVRAHMPVLTRIATSVEVREKLDALRQQLDEHQRETRTLQVRSRANASARVCVRLCFFADLRCIDRSNERTNYPKDRCHQLKESLLTAGAAVTTVQQLRTQMAEISKQCDALVHETTVRTMRSVSEHAKLCPSTPG